MALPLHYIFNRNNVVDFKYPMSLNSLDKIENTILLEDYRNCIFVSSRKKLACINECDNNNSLISYEDESSSGDDIESYMDCFSQFENESDCSSIYDYILENINDTGIERITIDETYFDKLLLD